MSIIRGSLDKFQYKIKQNSSKNIIAIKKDNDVTRNIDIYIESYIKNRIVKSKLPVKFISEECGTVDLSSSPEYVVILDPVDGTDIAIRGYPLCSISLSLHSISTYKPILAIIANAITSDIYCASGEGAFKIIRKRKTSIFPSQIINISDSMIVCYAAKPYRLLKIFQQEKLFGCAKLFLNYGGPLDIAKVGDGSIDCFLEFAKGFKIIDYAAGIFIAKTAGAIVTDLDDKEINILESVNMRQKFVVSANRKLHNKILKSLDTSKI